MFRREELLGEIGFEMTTKQVITEIMGMLKVTAGKAAALRKALDEEGWKA